MFKSILVILAVLLIAQKTFSQVDHGTISRAEYDSLLILYKGLKEDTSLRSNLLMQTKFRKFIYSSKKWISEHGTDEERAQFALIQWDYFYWLKSSDIYARIISAKEVWVYRDYLERNELRIVLGHLSTFYQRTKRPEDRLEVAKEICALESQMDSITHCGELAGIYHDLKQYDQAIKHYRSDIENAKLKKNGLNIASLNNNIGLAYRDMGMRDSAAFYFRRSLELLADKPLMLKNTSDRYLAHFINVVKWNLALILYDRITDEKVQLAKSLIRSGTQVREYFWVLTAYDLLAKYNYQYRYFMTATQYVDSAIILAKETMYMDNWIRLLRLKGKILLAEQKLQEADVYFERSDAIADSVSLAEGALNASIATAQFEAKEREQELKASREQTRVKSLEAERAHSQKLWFTGLFIASFVFLILVVILLRISRRNRKLIAIQNTQLETALDEKEELLKEVHHRVKNNLQVISSLLELQGMHIGDEKARAALEQGKSRVQSIALLHHQLYQHEDLAKVELNDFTRELAAQVMGVFNKPGQEVKLNIDIPESLIDIDTAVPLGLILNELLTNSFKYASPPAPNGGDFDNAQTYKNNQPLIIAISTEFISEAVESLPYGTSRLLVYRDNGPGLPKDFDLSKVNSLGLRLVSQLSKQIKGSSQYNYNKGAEFRITFRTK